jgi:hypothetical protein
MSSHARRWWLWGLALFPFVFALAALGVAHAWLNRHLHREIKLPGISIHLANPDLAWDLSFSADTVEVESRAFSLKAGAVFADLSVWQSLVSFRPTLFAKADTVDLRLDDSAQSAAAKKRRPSGKVPAFPNPRIPVPFRFHVASVRVARGERAFAAISGLRIQSEGPKGASVDLDSLSLRGSDSAAGDSLISLRASAHASARWFGKSVRYQARAQHADGDLAWLEGERKKSDLRQGQDTLGISVARLSDYAAFLPKKKIPDMRDLRIQASDKGNPAEAALLRVRFHLPSLLRFGPQDADLFGRWEDGAGRVVVNVRGEDNENIYLQGQMHWPGALDSAKALRAMTGVFAGFSRNVAVRLGKKTLPGDMEISRLRIHPGFVAEAEVRTRDSSTFQLRAGPDPVNGWKLVFSGKASPKESWAQKWTNDTNVSYSNAWVNGEFHPGQVAIQARIRGKVRAYGAMADSVIADQVVTKHGYYLLSSQVFGKEGVWPVKGQVEWGVRHGKAPRSVSLYFETRHPRFGFLRFGMPERKHMQAKAENLVVERFPYPRLEKIFPSHPVVSGVFDWNWLKREGSLDAKTSLTYAGEGFNASVKGNWDARYMHLVSLEAAGSGSDLRLSADLRLGGRQFHQLRGLRLRDLQGLSLQTRGIEASRLAALVPRLPVTAGLLNGRLTYDDSTGFGGVFTADNLEFKDARKAPRVSRLALRGEGHALLVSAVTASPSNPWLDDSLQLRVDEVLTARPTLELRAACGRGPVLVFRGNLPGLRHLSGTFALSGNAALAGGAGVIRDLRVEGSLEAPLDKSFLKELRVDSASLRGRYAAAGLDTQSFFGSWSVSGGRLALAGFKAVDGMGRSLQGEGEASLVAPASVTFKLRGQALALRLPDVQKLLFQDLEATVRYDSLGLSADAAVGRASFVANRAPINIQGDLEAASFSYRAPPPPSPGAAAPVPQASVKARLRNFLFQHKIGFRELQRFFRTVKVDKRKKKMKPVDLHLTLETAGSENRIETDILRMYFTGDITLKGVYPYTMLSGEFSALSGELGQSSQSYDVSDFDLKWQNATVEEGRISVEAVKKLRADCKPDTRRTCNVFIKLDGRLDDMAFTYDSDCGGATAGEAIKPTSLINSVSRGCFFEEDIAGSGGGNYGEAVFNFLEPAINEKLSSVGNKFTYGWIQSTQVTGIGTAISGDTTGSQPIAVNVESKEKWGVRLRGKAGYHQEKKLPNPWETMGAIEWRMPLEKLSKDSTWRRRVQDRITLEASAETRPEEKPLTEDQQQQVRKQVGIHYRYKFWDLW